jgi:hypothetical protein
MDLVLDLLHWNDFSNLLDNRDDLLLRLVVQMDDWLVNLDYVQVVLVDVVLMDSVLMKIFLYRGELNIKNRLKLNAQSQSRTRMSSG